MWGEPHTRYLAAAEGHYHRSLINPEVSAWGIERDALNARPASQITHAKGAGQAAQGLMTIGEVLARFEEKEEHGCLSEQLRIQGELLIFQGAPGATVTGEDHFRRALDAARRQGVLSWELRAATSIVRLWRDQHRMAKACKLLARV